MALTDRGGELSAAPSRRGAGGGGRDDRCERTGEAVRVRGAPGAPRRAGGGAQGVRARTARALQAPARGRLPRSAPHDPPRQGGSGAAQKAALRPLMIELSYQTDGGTAVVTIHNPPVNGLSH